MNIINNALSAKNVRMHGMSSDKWTTKDKITQFKGLVNLYRRDRQITEVDTAVASKRQQKGLQSLRKLIEIDRRRLENAIRGDKQKLRNTLAENRELQLAYENSDPKKVLEDIIQINFTKRKVLDKLQHQLLLKSRELIDLQLQESLLQDRLKYKVFNKLKEEEIAQNITGKVQDAILKKEAALQIQQTYTQIISLMKKDALYFDGILLTIRNDYWYQCRCVLNAAKQGQLATEYKDDREQEFETLEKAIYEDMKTQKADLEQVHRQVEDLSSNLKYLLRRDSDLTTCVVTVADTAEMESLRIDLDRIENTLKFLRSTTLVSSFDLIYPSFQEQRKQQKRLAALAKKCESNRNKIVNKVNHAETMSNKLQTSMVETTGEYRKRKKELKTMIQAEIENHKLLQQKRSDSRNLIAQVRISLKHIYELCKPINAQRGETEKPLTPTRSKSQVELAPPEEDESDGIKIIEELTGKLTYLMSNITHTLDSDLIDTAYRYYEQIMKDRCIEAVAEIVTDKTLLEGYTSEVAHLLTREDIKKQSEEIVAAHSKEDDVAPVSIGRKKRKFS